MLDGSPWYVKLVVYGLMWFGFPVIVTGFLLMVFTGFIPSPLTKLDKDMDGHMRDVRDLLKLAEVNQRVQRQICRNTSTNSVERTECDR